jgi:hypothetical protein
VFFLWFATFHAICWFCVFSFLLDDILELFFDFWSYSCASCDLGIEIQSLCLGVVNVLVKREIDKSTC